MKKKIFAFPAIALLSAGLAFSEKGEIYISPNNDGVQDFLEVPIKIKDKRYVTEWAFIIENEDGEIVRTISNKNKLEGGITLKALLKSFFIPKSGVTIPGTVVWNGMMDNGSVAPDGLYRYYVTASDDNGNTAKSKKLVVIVDNTPPEINVEQPDADGKIFGEGAKVVFNVEQSGSKEDKWTGVFSDAKGNSVLTKNWTESEPLPFEWNGTDDSGAILPDGVYSYKISAVDRAGNQSEPASISNIIYSSEKPVVSLALSDSRYFNKTIAFDVKIPLPDEKSPNKLKKWEVEISDESGKVVKKWSGKDNPPEKIVWEDTDSIKEGTFKAKAVASYTNGFETAPALSPDFVLDRTAPTAKLKSGKLTFSPDGDGNLDTLEIAQDFSQNTGSPVENWTGQIKDSKGKVIKEFAFGAFPPEKLVWDGTNSENQLAEDGTYEYSLVATDLAGNEAKVSPVSGIKLDTSTTEILLTLNRNAFNPKKPDSIKLSPIVKATSKITDFKLSILSEKGEEVWSQSGKALPSSFGWNGKRTNGAELADGKYIALLETQSENGAESSVKSKAFEIDTSAPVLDLQVPFALFSPDGDGRKDEVQFAAKSSDEETWSASLYDSNGTVVRSYTWKGAITPFDWDGKDAAGNTLPDGSYKIVFESEDSAGNKTIVPVDNLQIDNREAKVYITAEFDAFSPNEDGSFDTQVFAIRPTLNEQIEKWTFSIKDADGNVAKVFEGTDTLPAQIEWDGKDDSGNLVKDNGYFGSLSVLYSKGNLVETDSSAFISCATPPKLDVKTQPQFFSPDNDGEDDDLFVYLKGDSILPLKNWSFQIQDPKNPSLTFWTTSGKSSITEKIVWDGRSNSGELVQSATDYPYIFTVTDSLGMTSEIKGEINVDILVHKVGNQLKMAVPSIIFRSDAADFGLAKDYKGRGLTQKELENNERVLSRVAKVLNKFKNYKVQVVGHAHSMTGTEKEEVEELVPLSGARAAFVKTWLTKNGVDGSRLTTKGMGGREPIVARDDKPNRWKNRRVEFILDKNK